MTKQFVNELKKDDSVDSYFAVVEKEPVKKYAKGYSVSLKISDKTGVIIAKFWGGNDQSVVEQVFSSFDIQNVVQIKGTVGEWNGKLEFAINPDSGGTITKTDSYDIADLVPTTEKDIEKMKEDLQNIIEQISDSDIKRLLKSFFDDGEFLKQFAKSPAAMTRHHNFIGGLLEHILSLIDISKNIVKIHSKLNIDLLIAGCIFHDIGKIKEYESGLVGIGCTTDGRLFGHISIGYTMVSEKIEKLKPFDEIIAKKILHMILSHHGQLDWGSPVEPAFPEAIALHYIDQVDAKIKGVLQEIEKFGITEDWSGWVKDYGRLFLK